MNPGIDKPTFSNLRRQYQARWQISLVAAMPDGRIVLGKHDCRRPGDDSCASARAHAIAEGLRWGEPTVEFCPRRRLIWAVPLLRNARLLGGLVASAGERRVFPDDSGKTGLDVRRACSELREMAEAENLTNAALLATRRSEYHSEQKRAEAIHEFKQSLHYSIRGMYLREEPALVAAVRKADRAEARGILNRLLVGLLHHAGGRLDLVKSFFMELVVTLCRTAVEAGGAPQQLLGANYAHIAELSRMASEEELAPWLHHMLERIMDSIHANRRSTNDVLLYTALQYMSEHAAEDISREEVARAAHMSPAHFSRIFRKEMGRTFTDLLNQMRVNRAAELMRRTDRSLALVALDAGFRDQSYFTKVFRRYFESTPLQYRRRVRR